MITALPPSTWLQGVTYDEPTRQHSIDGQRAPSVTQILKAAGLSGQFDHVKPDVLARKASIGNATHIATHYSDEGDLDASTVAPEAASRLKAWQWFRECRRCLVILLETVVCSREYGYVGRLDRLLLVEGRLVLLDLKTGKPSAARADLQLAAYLIALLEQFPELRGQLIERWAIELRDTGKYCLHTYPTPGRTGRQDKADFLDAVAAVHADTAIKGEPCWGM